MGYSKILLMMKKIIMLRIIFCLSFITILLLCTETIKAAKNDEGCDIFIEFDDNGHAAIMLGDDVYEIDESGQLTLLNPPQLTTEEEKQIVSATAALGIVPILSRGISTLIRWLFKHLNKWDFIKKIRRVIFPRKISNVEKDFIKESRVKKKAGRSVAQRDNIINRKKECFGTTSCNEMIRGNAPFDSSCQRINLHHILQEDDGLIIELTQEEHQRNTKELHSHSDYSEIPRDEFNRWKKTYWQSRHSELCSF